MYDIRTAPKNLFQMILKAYERSSFLGCSIEVLATTIFGKIKAFCNARRSDFETARSKRC